PDAHILISAPRERVGRRLPDLGQRVAVGVMERLGLAADHQDGVFVVGPRALADRDLDPVLDGLEGVLEERVRADAVGLCAARRDELEARGVLGGPAERHRDLATGDRERLDEVARRRLPQPVADLVVVGLDLPRLDDVRVIAQAVEELRPVGLGSDRLQLDGVDEALPLGPVRLGIHVEAADALPDAGHVGERTEILQGMGVDVGRLGVDVDGIVAHRVPPQPIPRQSRVPSTRMLRNRLPSSLRWSTDPALARAPCRLSRRNAMSEPRSTTLTPETMTADQKRVADAIQSGPRGAGLRGPFNALLRSPELCDLVQRVGAFVRFGTSIPHRLNEMAIIMAGRKWTAQYEFYAHRRLALEAGLSPAIADAIAANQRPVSMAKDEETVYDFVSELLATGSVSDRAFQRVKDAFGERGVVDLVGAVGYYSLVSMTLNVARVPLPAGVTPPLP